MMKKILIVLIAGLAACAPGKETPSMDPGQHQAEVEAWYQKRVEDLKGPKGWLNIAGLYWLNDGINTFGSGDKNNIVFPAGTIPEFAGYFLLSNGTVTIHPSDEVNITSKGKPVKNQVIFNPDSVKKATTLDYGSLEWFIIKRDSRYGVRLRNFRNPAIEDFKGIERYPVDVAWRRDAKFVKADSARRIDITNVLGQTTSQPSPGSIVFEIDGKEYKLDILDEGGEDYFLIFGDSTNARETYGAGRFMAIKHPDANNMTVIDFNKAYNPPCAFTEFATCPLPPKQNVMNIEVKAGEKNYEEHH